MLRLIILSYAFLFIGLRVFIFFPPGENVQQINISEMELNNHTIYSFSDRLDGQQIKIKGVVVQSGHLLLDLFFIKSYKLEISDGSSIRVFPNSTTPSAGTKITVEATFRQIYQGQYFFWVGLYETKRSP